MQSIGVVLHVSKNNFLVLRGESPQTPPIRSKVQKKDKTPVGRVKEVFGPVKNPYISVKPRKDLKIDTLIGEKLYV